MSKGSTKANGLRRLATQRVRLSPEPGRRTIVRRLTWLMLPRSYDPASPEMPPTASPLLRDKRGHFNISSFLWHMSGFRHIVAVLLFSLRRA